MGALAITKLSTLLLMLILTILSQNESNQTIFADAKVAKCRELLNKYDKNFFYCTKFSVG